MKPCRPPSACGLLTYTFVALVLPLAAITRGPTGRAARALGRGAGRLYGLGASPDRASSPRRLVADRAGRPSRVAPAGARHPVPGLPICLRRSLSETRARASRRRRSGLQRDRDSSAATRRRLPTFVRLSPREVGLLVTLWVGTSLLYPSIREVRRVVRRHDRAATSRLRHLESRDHATYSDAAGRARRCSPMSARCCSRP